MLTINGRVCSGDKFWILNFGWGPIKVAQAVLDRLGTELRFTYIPFGLPSQEESNQKAVRKVTGREDAVFTSWPIGASLRSCGFAVLTRFLGKEKAFIHTCVSKS
jgi:hypothetical protein